MAHETTHILYEWETFTEVEIMGQKRRYSDGPKSIIAHRLDTLAAYPQIPANAFQTRVYWSSYNERWCLANGQELHLPHKIHQ